MVETNFEIYDAIFSYMVDSLLGRKEPRSRNIGEILCAVMSVSRWIIIQHFLQNRKNVHESRYQMKARVYLLYDMGKSQEDAK